jgi:formyl-CoA transferase
VVTGPVYTAADVVNDSQFRARDMLVPHYDAELDEHVLGPGLVPKFSESVPHVRWAGPSRAGSHNSEVYQDLLGMDSGALERLTRLGVI